MVTKLFCVYDSKAKVFKMPHFTRTNGDALRGFALAANDSKTEISMFPEDFTLMEIGEFDDVTGKVTGPNFPVNLGMASSYLNAPRVPQIMETENL
ncbi:MAG: nonstructural protein [Arizlama microvirus]|nr:MAG: nonstructural protein [Arizlama microvirus]